MESNDQPVTIARNEKYYFESGDLVARVENSLFRFHSFHLRRATSSFDDTLDKIIADPSLPGSGNDETPLTLDGIDAKDFAALLWFFYESAYKWSASVDRSDALIWESILLCAEKFQMLQVAKVACHALDRAGILGDIRKISLCAKHRMGNAWVQKELKRVVSRSDALSADEARMLGLDVTVILSAAREDWLHLPKTACYVQCAAPTCPQCGEPAVCFRSAHVCKPRFSKQSAHYRDCPNEVTWSFNNSFEAQNAVVSKINLIEGEYTALAPASLRSFDKGYIGTGDVFFKVEERLFRIHSYHLRTASLVFADMFSLPSVEGQAAEGTSEDNPIHLHVEAYDFENLLYFFYDSAYEWSPTVDSTTIPLWESVLRLAHKFDMEDAKRLRSML